MKKEAWEFTKINFRWMLVAGAFLFLYMQGCFKQFTPQAPTVTHDTTVIVHHYESAPYQPAVVNVLPPKATVINLPEYQADTSSIQSLRKQFDELVKKHTEQNVYNDTLKIDSLGYVNVKDTVSENKLASRSYNFNIKERLITTTITQPYKPRNQVFVGAGISFIPNTQAIQSVDAGIMFKNKKDAQIGISPTYDFNSKQFGGRISYYNKIKLKLF